VQVLHTGQELSFEDAGVEDDAVLSVRIHDGTTFEEAPFPVRLSHPGQLM